MSNTTAVHLTSDDFQKTLDEAKAAGQPVFVDFFAEWCGPCQMAAPIVDKLAGDFAEKAVVAKLDVDGNNDIAAQFGVMSIPTAIVFKDGEEVDRLIGFRGEAGYKEMIDRALNG